MSMIKSWDRPWSMDEMIENSNNWSLAGDVALLNSLQNFADKLLEKTNQTNDNIENLINNLEETNLQLNIAQNRFQNLRNTQFIESRVYDDDDGIVQLEIDDNSKKIEDRDEDHRDDISTAISRGLDILDHYFDKIQVTVSDSDDDDNDRISDKDQDQNDLQSVILKPKDLYINRPLPYVIGTDEWHQKWHVGLEDSSDDSDTEKISDNYSESDSESTDLQLIFDRSQIKSSDTSSEFDNNNKQTKQQLTKDDQQSTTTSGSDEIIKQTTTTTTNFAQQLAEKLDRVVGNTGIIEEKPEIIPEPEVNTRPIQKLPTKSTNYRDIFFDEPPPLDDIPPVNRYGLFSGGGGLFDDNDDDNDDLWSSKSSKPQPTINDNNTNQTNEQSGLFNDDDDDDDIFKTKEPSKVLPTVFQKSQLPVFNDEPPPVEEPKKPIGGISIFGGNELLNQQLLKRRQISDEDTDTDNDKKTNDETIEEPPQIINDQNDNNDKTVETKKISLFDDDDDNDDLFKDDLFTSNITSKKFTSTLFNDNDDDKNDLFTEQSNHPDDSINSLNNDDSLKLFDDTTPSVSNDDIFNDLPKITEDITSKSSTLKLFDDIADNDDDLFKLNIDTHQTNENKQSKKPDTSLFDTTPPILNDNDDDVDDDDFNSSRKFLSQQLFDDDIVDIKPESSKISNRSVIDDQPPKLDDNDDDNHQKIQSPGKLKHNLNINVAALMPGGLPPLKRNDISKIEVRNTEINEISTGFDTTDRVEVLQSVTKARARLPLNRRPSTRRGRKAALETSSKDFKINNDKIDNKNDIDDVINEEIDKKSELFKNDNFDDLFKNDENSKSGNVAKVDDLFGEIQKSEVKKVDTVKTRGLFDDDDDENNDADLFTTRKQPVVKKTRSLFDDDDDLDDDIFKTTANHSKKPEIKPTTDRKLSKPSGNIKKLDHSQPDDDPLGILNLNDN